MEFRVNVGRKNKRRRRHIHASTTPSSAGNHGHRVTGDAGTKSMHEVKIKASKHTFLLLALTNANGTKEGH